MQGLGRGPGDGTGGQYAYGYGGRGGGGAGEGGYPPGGERQGGLGYGQGLYASDPYDEQAAYLAQQQQQQPRVPRELEESFLGGRGGQSLRNHGMPDDSRGYSLDEIRRQLLQQQQQQQQQQQLPSSLAYSADYQPPSSLGYHHNVSDFLSQSRPSSSAPSLSSYLDPPAARQSFTLPSATSRADAPGLYELGALAGREAGLNQAYGTGRYGSPLSSGALSSQMLLGGQRQQQQSQLREWGEGLALPSSSGLPLSVVLQSNAAMTSMGASPTQAPAQPPQHHHLLGTAAPRQVMPSQLPSVLDQAIAYGSATMLGTLREQAAHQLQQELEQQEQQRQLQQQQEQQRQLQQQEQQRQLQQQEQQQQLQQQEQQRQLQQQEQQRQLQEHEHQRLLQQQEQQRRAEQARSRAWGESEATVAAALETAKQRSEVQVSYLSHLRSEAARVLGGKGSMEQVDEVLRRWRVQLMLTESGEAQLCYVDASGRIYVDKTSALEGLLAAAFESDLLPSAATTATSLAAQLAAGSSRPITPATSRPLSQPGFKPIMEPASSLLSGALTPISRATVATPAPPLPPPAPPQVRLPSPPPREASPPPTGAKAAYFQQARQQFMSALQQVPLQVGPVTVLSFGKVDWTRPAYHCETEIWPIGFKSVRLEYSQILQQMVCLTFDITDGGEKGPMFKISLEWGRSVNGAREEASGGAKEKEKVTFSGRRPVKPWKDVFDRICKAEKEAVEEKAARRGRRRAREGGVRACRAMDEEEQKLRERLADLHADKSELQLEVLKERVAILAAMKGEAGEGQLLSDGGDVDGPDGVDRRTFFTRSIAALIEGMPGAERCGAYRCLQERCPAVMEHDPSPSPPFMLSPRERREDGGRHEEDRKRGGGAEDEEKRRRKEEARSQAQLLRFKDKEERKRAKEAEREERKSRMAEAKRKREERKEVQRGLRRLRTLYEAEIRVRRLAVRSALHAAMELESVNTPCAEDGLLLQDDATLDGYDRPLPTPTRRRRLGQSSSSRMLQPSLMTSVVQIWDFLYTFGARLRMSEVPSLSVLLRAFEAADAAVVRPPTSSERRRVDLLHDLALKLVTIILPDLLRLLTGPQGEHLADKVPVNHATWPDLARSYLVGTAFKSLELFGDPGFALRGRGVNFQLDQIDRRCLALARLRLMRPMRWSQVEADPTAMTLTVPTPTPTVLQPLSWQADLESLRLLPRTAVDLIKQHVDRAARAMEAAGIDHPAIKAALAEAQSLLAEAKVGEAVDKALASLDHYQAQLLAQGVQPGNKEGDARRVAAAVVKNLMNEGEEDDEDDMGEEECDLDDVSGHVAASPAQAAAADDFKSPLPRPPSSRAVTPVTTPALSTLRPPASSSKPRRGGGEEESDEEEDEDDEEAEGEEGEVQLRAFEGRPEVVQRCARVVHALMASPHAAPFLRKPSRETLRDYYDVVLRPIALHDVLHHLQHGDYDHSVGRFAADVRLIFANCATFNAEGELLLGEADRLSAQFERLLLTWVLDPQAPPVDCLLSVDHCILCHKVHAPSSAPPSPVGPDDGEGGNAAKLITCDRCDASFHPECIGLPPHESGDWFCYECIDEKCLRDVDPYLRLRLVKALPGRGCFVGHVSDVTYTPTGAVYRVKFEEGHVSFTEDMAREELAAMVAAQVAARPEDPSSAELTQRLLQRPPEIDAKAEFESLGYAGWGMGTLVDGKKSVPRRLDPQLSLLVKRRAMEDSDLVGVHHAIHALDVDKKSADDWLACLLALISQVGNLPDLRTFLDEKEVEVGSVVQQLLETDPLRAQLPDSLRPGVGATVKLQEEPEQEEDEEEEEEEEQEEEEEEIEDEETEDEESSMEEDEAEDSDDEDFVEVKKRRPSPATVKKDDDEEEDEEEEEEANEMEVDEEELDFDEPPSSTKQQPPVKKEPPPPPQQQQAASVPSDRKSAEAKPPPTQPPKPPPQQPPAQQQQQQLVMALPAKVEALTVGAKAEAPSELEQVRAIRARSAGLVLTEALLPLVRRRYGKKGIKLLGSLKVAEEQEEEHDDLMDDDEAEDEADEEGDNHHEEGGGRPVCVYCKEDDRFLASIMVYGPNRDEWRALGYALDAGLSLPAAMAVVSTPDHPITDVLWKPVDPQLAAEEEPLYARLARPVRQGSLVMHEVCAETVVYSRALAALRSRGKERRAAVEGGAFIGRGRTCPLGRDRKGRLYWQLAAEPQLLFVQPFDENGQFECHTNASQAQQQAEAWVVFETDEDVARVMAYLNPAGVREAPLLSALERQYPQAAKLFNEQGRARQLQDEAMEAMDEGQGYDTAKDGQGLAVGEEVLLTGPQGLQWAARVLCVAEEGDEARYLVQVEGWEHGSVWVSAGQTDSQGRPVLQRRTGEAEEQRSKGWSEYAARQEHGHGRPRWVESLRAYKYVGTSKRNRGGPKGTRESRLKFDMRRFEDDEAMYEIKCAMLVLEAALPIGCMYDVPEERSRPLKLRRDELPDWVKRVEAARTATELMQALLLLEHSVDTNWRKRPFRDAYVAVLPSWTFALKHATLHSLALRIWSLDQLLDYDKVNTETSYEGRKKQNQDRLKPVAQEDYLVVHERPPQSFSRAKRLPPPSQQQHHHHHSSASSTSSSPPDVSELYPAQGGSASKRYKRYS